MISFTVEIGEYVDWAEKTISSFHRMAETMKNVAEIIKLETIPLVPLETSALEQSYQYVVKKSSPFILLALGFDVEDEKSGFHYAQYQHDVITTPQHPIRGEQFYLTKGISYAEDEAFHLIEQDYMSLFANATVGKGRTNIDELLHPKFVYFDLEDWLD